MRCDLLQDKSSKTSAIRNFALIGRWSALKYFVRRNEWVKYVLLSSKIIYLHLECDLLLQIVFAFWFSYLSYV